MMTTNNKRKLRQTAAAADIARLACRVTHISISEKIEKTTASQSVVVLRPDCVLSSAYSQGAFDNWSAFLAILYGTLPGNGRISCIIAILTRQSWISFRISVVTMRTAHADGNLDNQKSIKSKKKVD